MLARAGARKRARHADNVPVARLELVGEADLGGGRVLKEAVRLGDLVAGADQRAGGGVEGPDGGGDGGAREGDAAEGSAEGHFDGLDVMYGIRMERRDRGDVVVEGVGDAGGGANRMELW